MEVKHQGEWGTVHGDNWSLKDASVVCRQLGCGAAISIPKEAYFGPGLGPIWLLYTSCEGVESAVSVSILILKTIVMIAIPMTGMLE